MTANLTTLQHQLTEFGLNPSDWTIEVKGKMGSLTRIDVHSLTASDLHFQGWAREGALLTLALCES